MTKEECEQASAILLEQISRDTLGYTITHGSDHNRSQVTETTVNMMSGAYTSKAMISDSEQPSRESDVRSLGTHHLNPDSLRDFVEQQQQSALLDQLDISARERMLMRRRRKQQQLMEQGAEWGTDESAEEEAKSPKSNREEQRIFETSALQYEQKLQPASDNSTIIA